MNVEKLRKINVLASTLKEQGLAASSEDASSLANTMVPNKQEEDFGNVFAQSAQNVVIDNDAEQQKEDDNKEEKTTFTEQQVRNILQSFSDQFCAEINKLTEKHAELEDAIAKLKTERVSPSEKTVSEQELKQALDEGSMVELEPEQKKPAETSQPEAPNTGNVAQQAEPEKPKQEQRQSPRSGGYHSDDVSIEKFFYYGQK